VAKQYWLMKSEPDSFSIADLETKQVEPWSGVRNYMARFHMRAMAIGDEVLFHHSSCDPPGVAGLARVVRTGVVDETQFDPASQYYDPRATRAKPVWDCVDVEYVKTLANYVPIERMRAEPALANMLLLKRGMRLSVQPVTEAEYRRIVAMADEAWEPPPKPKQPAKPKRAAKPVASKSPKSPKRRAPAKRAVKKPAAKPRSRR
jgi:predicted RNA-binding protein with PUA-like domain